MYNRLLWKYYTIPKCLKRSTESLRRRRYVHVKRVLLRLKCSAVEKSDSGRNCEVLQEKGPKGRGGGKETKGLKRTLSEALERALISCLIKRTRKRGLTSCGKKPTHCETQSLHRPLHTTSEATITFPFLFSCLPLGFLQF